MKSQIFINLVVSPIMKCIIQYSNHEVSENMLLQRFYRESYQLNKSIIDNTFGGCLVKLSYGVASNLLNQVTKLSKGWHTIYAEVAVGVPFTTFMDQEKRRRNEERDVYMDKIITQLNML